MENTTVKSWTSRNLMFWLFFSNGRPDQNKLSKDRWTILKISKDLTELTDIHGRKLEKRKEQITHFGAGEVEHEKENIDSDASGKRKSSDSELPRYNKVRVIVANPELNAGRAEPEKENNPQQESDELYEQRHENEELYEQRHENDSHQVEHEKENKDSDASGKRKSSEMGANVE